MNIITPFKLSDVSLVSSNVSATDPTALAGTWNPATAYTAGQIVQVDSPTFTFTVAANTTTLACIANGLDDGILVKVSSTTTLPAGLSANTAYFVVQSTTDSIKLSLTRDGTPIICTAAGTGTQTITASTHLLYERLIAGTSATVPRNDTVNWLLLGFTNRWMPFDSMVTSVAQNTSIMQYVIDVNGRADSVALINISGAYQVEILVQDPSNGYATAYDTTTVLNARSGPVNSWYTFFLTQIISRYGFAAFDLPPIGNPRITITLTGTGNTIQLGALVVGRSSIIGEMQFGATLGIIDYSLKTTDAFGNFNITPRSYSDRVGFPVSVDSVSVDGVKRLLTQLRSTACVYAGSADYDSTIVYGFFKDFSITIAYPTYSIATINVEGLN